MNDRAMTCPYCGETVPLDAPVCPECREDLSALARLCYAHSICYNQALALAREDKLDQARDRLLMAVAQRPDFAAAHALLAKVYARRGDWPEARARAARVLESLARRRGRARACPTNSGRRVACTTRGCERIEGTRRASARGLSARCEPGVRHRGGHHHSGGTYRFLDRRWPEQ